LGELRLILLSKINIPSRPGKIRELKKIGIYGGTFDPIHHAHLILAREALELLHLEKIIFIPAAASPFKDIPAADGKIRLSMLRAAIKGEDRFVIDDCELRREPPSYTIDTVQEIRQREQKAKIYCLIGSDNLAGLPNWHRFSELERQVHFVVLDRTGADPNHSFPVIRRKLDISATNIRKRVALGQSIRYLVPPAVEKIIGRGKLYREHAK
jgi:nicotinate-nucleotide adenylyltransferase